MTHIQNLPSAGAKFSAKSGVGSFQTKLTRGIHTAGELSSLQHHPEAVKSLVGHIAKYQTHIRRGGLSQSQIKKIESEVTKSDSTLTGTAKKLISKTLSHLSSQSKVSPARPALPTRNETKPGQFTYKRPTRDSAPTHITSIANQTGKTTTFHQSGDVVVRSKTGERSNVSVSISEIIKNKRASNAKSNGAENITTITQAPIEDIKD